MLVLQVRVQAAVAKGVAAGGDEGVCERLEADLAGQVLHSHRLAGAVCWRAGGPGELREGSLLPCPGPALRQGP